MSLIGDILGELGITSDRSISEVMADLAGGPWFHTSKRRAAREAQEQDLAKQETKRERLSVNGGEIEARVRRDSATGRITKIDPFRFYEEGSEIGKIIPERKKDDYVQQAVENINKETIRAVREEQAKASEIAASTMSTVVSGISNLTDPLQAQKFVDAMTDPIDGILEAGPGIRVEGTATGKLRISADDAEGDDEYDFVADGKVTWGGANVTPAWTTAHSSASDLYVKVNLTNGDVEVLTEEEGNDATHQVYRIREDDKNLRYCDIDIIPE